MKRQQTYKGFFDSWYYEDYPYYQYKPDKDFDRKLAKARLKQIERQQIRKELDEYDSRGENQEAQA